MAKHAPAGGAHHTRRTEPEPPTRRTRLWFAVVAAHFLLWIAFLATLAVTTANPVVVSRLYAGRCRAIARLTILPPTPDLPEGQSLRRCRVLAVYKGDVSGPEITVALIPPHQRQANRTVVAFIEPVHDGLYKLQPIGNCGYDATRDRHVPCAPELYPDTPGVLRQLAAMFGPPSPPTAPRPATQPSTQPARPAAR